MKTIIIFFLILISTNSFATDVDGTGITEGYQFETDTHRCIGFIFKTDVDGTGSEDTDVDGTGKDTDVDGTGRATDVDGTGRATDVDGTGKTVVMCEIK